MPNPIRFALVLHNHQPVGNFDHVFEQAYQESYLPFLDVFDRYDSLRITLHTSGSLMEWIESRHPDYVDRLAKLVERGRMEIIGGAFYEPILAMLPSRDRIGQIRSYTSWLENRLGASVRGAWTPERVWEQGYVRDLVEAGIEYTVLDDFHFKNAGLAESQLVGHFLTEDDGRVMSVFPGSERLRYLIPFGMPQQTIDYLAGIAERHPGSVVVFGDDGEKFGTWPGTHKHVYDDGWLVRFLDALVANQDWLQSVTLADAVDTVAPVGKVYLPDSSYREMTEWALPVERQIEYDRLVHEIEGDPRWPGLRGFVRGGFWRNFKVKYPEANEMYSRMMQVSRRIERVEAANPSVPLDEQTLEAARTELYRGQCNCAYWHGAFGGIYLPHLRNAVYDRLIAADNLLERVERRPEHWVDAVADDLDFDGRQEIRLANDKLVALVAPGRGGQLYELDVRQIRHNLLATLARRPEAYHAKVLAGSGRDQGDVASIHDRVVFKQEGLERMLQYDAQPRKSLLDRFHDDEVSLEAIASGAAPQHGDFLDGAYEARVRRNPDRIQVQLSRAGTAYGKPLRITKGLTLDAGSSTLDIAYVLEGLPPEGSAHFSVELNFAGMPSGLEDRYFCDANGHAIGDLGTRLDLRNIEGLGLVDRWLGIDVALRASCPTHFWTYPIQTVSQSEGGFELVHQSVVVQPHWHVQPDAKGRWTVTLRMAIDTSRAENHNEHTAVAAAT
jgi:4-alpha-glucanotransferase